VGAISFIFNFLDREIWGQEVRSRPPGQRSLRRVLFKIFRYTGGVRSSRRAMGGRREDEEERGGRRITRRGWGGE